MIVLGYANRSQVWQVMAGEVYHWQS